MVATLARKEMRELAPLILLGLAIELLLASSAAGMRTGIYDNHMQGQIPFVSDGSTMNFFYVAGALACALGLWQTMLESTRETFQFLLHRPLSRDAIFGTKLVVGGVATLAVTIAPVLCYSLWAATPGAHASPFRWSMTTADWLLCLQLPLVYLGAFLTGLRPGRWFGSRVFPVAGSIGALMMVRMLAPWPWAMVAATVAAELICAWLVLGVGRTRDFS
jgi:hypothetical protein